MAGYDAEIRINTKISIAEAKMNLKRLESELTRAGREIERQQKNLAKLEPKMREYENKAEILNTQKARDMAQSLTPSQKAATSEMYGLQQMNLADAYSGVFFEADQYNAALQEARQNQAELTSKVAEARAVLNETVVAEQRQKEAAREAAEAKKEQVAAERQQAREAREAAKEEEKLSSEAARAQKRMASSANGIARSMIKWSTAMLGVRGVIGILRKSVSAFLSDNESIANQLTAIWSAIGNALGPIITRIIGLIQTLFAAISAFVKALTGVDMIANYNAKALEKQADATAGAGSAAEEASKQLAGFDEMNKLSDTSSSSGGGGGGSSGVEVPDILGSIDNWLTNFATKLGMTVKDVFFDWGDEMTEEDIAKKLIVLLNQIAGGGIGFALGGPAGALIGLLIGTGVGLLLGTLLFDNDGVLSKNEILKMFTGALGGLLGGIIGLAIGGPVGALIGIAIGAGVTLLLTGIEVEGKDGQKTNLLYKLLHDVLGMPSDQEIIAALNETGDLFVNFALDVDGAFRDIDDAVYEFIQKAIRTVGEFFSGLWEDITGWFGNAVEFVSSIFGWFGDIFSGFIDWLTGGKTSLEELNGEIEEGQTIIEDYGEKVGQAGDSMGDYATDVENASKRVEDSTNQMSDDATMVSEEMSNAVGDAFDEMTKDATENTAKMNSKAAANTKKMRASVSADTRLMRQSVGSEAEGMAGEVAGSWDDIQSAFANWSSFWEDLGTKIRNVFKNIGSALGSSISGAIKTAINNVLTKIQNTINSAIGIINGAINVINLLPGVSVGYISTVTLPRLAKGGIVNNPGMGVPAIIGEAGKEAVLPLERNTEWMDTLADKLAAKSGSGQVVIPMYLSGKKIAEYVVDLNKRRAFATNNA